MNRHFPLAVLSVAVAGTVACGAPKESTRQTISAADTAAAFGHTQVDTTARAKRATITQSQLDSQNAAIRDRSRGAKIAAPKRIERKSP